MASRDRVAGPVLIVEHDEGIAELVREILAGAGYEAERTLASPQLVAEVVRRRPALLILGLPPYKDSTLPLLEALAADACARSIPVLAITSCERIAVPILNEFNVCKIITEPFDVEDFIAEVRRILEQAPPAFDPTPTGGDRGPSFPDAA